MPFFQTCWISSLSKNFPPPEPQEPAKKTREICKICQKLYNNADLFLLSEKNMANNESFLQQNTAAGAEISHLNDDVKIKEILSEQEKLQKLYNEVVAYIQQHSQMPTEEMIKYQTQLKQLSEYYQLNQQKLKTLGYSNVQVNKNVVLKQGARKNISIKTILLGCGSIVFLFLLGLIFLFSYLLKNPQQLWGFAGLGITAAVAKDLLSGLTLTVMIVVLLLGIVILIINVYKAFTKKNSSKLRYYAGIALWFFILILALVAGTNVLTRIKEINLAAVTNPNEVVLFYLKGVPDEKNENIQITQERPIPLIAPMNMKATVIRPNFQKFTNIELGSQKVTGLQLDCGNGSVINMTQKNEFERYCFYTKKGNYLTRLIIHYETPNKEKKTVPYALRQIVVGSELVIQGLNKQLTGGQNELVVGPLPAEVEFKADRVFRDFNLSSYKVRWDGNNDGNEDKIDDVTFRFTYDQAKVYYPKVRFPEISEELTYTFPLRVEQSGIPVCKIKLSEKTVNNYDISASFFDDTERFIESYSFVVLDKATWVTIDAFNKGDNGMQFPYAFPGKWTYIVRMNFVTTDDKKGSCETEAKLLEKSSFNVNYEVHASSPNDMTYKKMDMNPILQKKTIALPEIPTKLKLKLIKIEPKTFNTKVNVFLDDKPVVFTTEGEYLFDITDAKHHKIKLQIQDKVRGLDYEENLTTMIGLDDVIGKLQVIGDSVGFEPFEVTLDASSSRLNDPADQITYFTWDFGDGQQQQKVSNGVIKHRYRFDYTKNNGTFKPKVTVYTQKWRSVTVESSNLVVVKKQLIKLEINPDSHPTQEAKIWDVVSFSLDFNGLPKKVSRDFGDGTPAHECEGRTCTEMTKTRSKKGTYRITVKMDFEDQQSIEQTMEFRIRE